MEKGMLTKAATDVLLAMLANAVKDQPPTIKVGLSIGGKLVVLIGDDMFAERLPEELKVKSRAFFDVLLVTKDYDAAIPLGIDLLTEVYELFKKPGTAALLPTPVIPAVLPPKK